MPKKASIAAEHVYTVRLYLGLRFNLIHNGALLAFCEACDRAALPCRAWESLFVFFTDGTT